MKFAFDIFNYRELVIIYNARPFWKGVCGGGGGAGGDYVFFIDSGFWTTENFIETISNV